MPGSPPIQLSAPFETIPINWGPCSEEYTCKCYSQHHQQHKNHHHHHCHDHDDVTKSGDPESPGQGPPRSLPTAQSLPGANCWAHSLFGGHYDDDNGLGDYPDDPVGHDDVDAIRQSLPGANCCAHSLVVVFIMTIRMRMFLKVLVMTVMMVMMFMVLKMILVVMNELMLVDRG